MLSPNPQRIRNLPISLLPAKYRDPLVASGLAPTSTCSGVRLRMKEAGNRTNEVSSDATRFVAGASGTFGSWDYDAAISRSESTVADKYINGHVLFDKFDAAVRAGTVNPFDPSSAAGQALIDTIKVNDEARKSKGTTEAVDAKASTATVTLGAAPTRKSACASSRPRRCCCAARPIPDSGHRP